VYVSRSVDVVVDATGYSPATPPAPPTTSPTPTTADAGIDMQAWVSSPYDPDRRLLPVPAASDPPSVAIEVRMEPTGRRWFGTGAALTDATVDLIAQRPELVDLLFEPGSPDGARLDTIRLPLSATDFSTSRWTWDLVPSGGLDSPPRQILDAVEVASWMHRKRPDLQVVVAPWTAAAHMKSPETLLGGDLAIGGEEEFAHQLVEQVLALRGLGVPVRALSIVNEPGHSGNYPTMRMTDDQLALVADLIDPDLDSINVELWAVDHNWADRSRVDRALSSSPGSYERGAFHCYAGVPEQMSGLAIDAIVSECTGTTDGWASTFRWDADNLIARSIASGSTGLIFWNLVLDDTGGPKLPGGCENCRGLLTVDRMSGEVSTTPEYYAAAHLARAVEPGWEILASPNTVGWPMAAFRAPDGQVGVVGLNDTGTDAVLRLEVEDAGSVTVEARSNELFTVRVPAR
jgi:glucosylceramidase